MAINSFHSWNFFHALKFIQEHHLSVKQIASRSGPTFCRAWSVSKLFANVVSRRHSVGNELLNLIAIWRHKEEWNCSIFQPFTTIALCSLNCLCSLVTYNANNMSPAQTTTLEAGWPGFTVQQYLWKTATLIKTKNDFQDWLLLNAGQKYTAILSTFIKLPVVIKVFVLSIFEWPFYTGFTVYASMVKVFWNAFEYTK